MTLKKYSGIILALLVTLLQTSNAQIIIKPNGDAAPKPNLPSVKRPVKLSAPALTATVSNLTASGKTRAQIAAILKLDKVTAKDVFASLKTTTPDQENVGALCTAGYFLRDIAAALQADGKTAGEATGLLKNSPGCSFSRTNVLQAIQSVYRTRLRDLVPVIKENYTTVTQEIVDCLIQVLAIDDQIIDAIEFNNLAANRMELCRLLKNKLPFFDQRNLNVVFRKLLSTHFRVATTLDNDIADALLIFDITATRVLEIFKEVYFTSEDPVSCNRLAAIAKHLNLSRDDAAGFLRRYRYTATQVLDALQAAYG